jgi:hypothetical protein
MNKNSYPFILWRINFKNNKLHSIQTFPELGKVPINICVNYNKNKMDDSQKQENTEFFNEMSKKFDQIKKEFSKPLIWGKEAAYLKKALNVAHDLKNLFELIKELHKLIKRFPPSNETPPKKFE